MKLALDVEKVSAPAWPPAPGHAWGPMPPRAIHTRKRKASTWASAMAMAALVMTAAVGCEPAPAEPITAPSGIETDSVRSAPTLSTNSSDRADIAPAHLSDPSRASTEAGARRGVPERALASTDFRGPGRAPHATPPRIVLPPAKTTSSVETAIRMTDVTAETGITFVHSDGGNGEGYIVEAMASGLVLFDYDQDGFEDIYFLNGAPLKGTPIPDPPPRNTLYRNNGDWTFTDVTETAGVGDTGFTLGGTAGDYDNDGDQDLFVANFGANVLYRNNGDGTFTDVTEAAGVADPKRMAAGCNFFDMDGDGDLDLYVANYVDFNYDNHVPIVVDGHHYKAGPQYYRPVPDALFRNEGDGTFTDVSKESGIGLVAGPGMATICADFNDDGFEDVYVCNDGKPNYLFLNDGTGRFTESAVMAGLAYDYHGKANSSMGVDCADYDGDGLLDLFVTGYQSEMPVLYHNLGNGLFEDATSAARIDGDLFAHVHWAAAFADFDNDGDQDLFVACGHFDEIERMDDRTSFKVRNYLLMNLGNGTFADVGLSAGSGLAVVESSRAAAFGDLDNDGDLDGVVLNSATAPTIMRNDSTTEHHWLQISLRQPEKNILAVGARVRVASKSRTQTSIVVSGRGYQGHHGSRLHFGLGADDAVESVEVRWPGGVVERFRVEGVDRHVELVAGTGEAGPQ